MELTNYKISNHACERYAQRLLNKEDTNSVNKFIIENKEKIKTDLNKMISFGELLYIGKQSQKDGKGNVLNVYLKDIWIILVDVKAEVVVTIFRIDLGCDDEDFNLQYISKKKSMLDEKKKQLEEIQMEVAKESKMYKEMIEENCSQINEYKTMIKNMEGLNAGYQSVIDCNTVKISQANREVAEVLNSLIGKREF